MSSSVPNGADRRVSKVTFQPINQETLVVSIGTVVPSPGDGLTMELPRRSESLDSKRRSKTHRSLSLKSFDQSTMTEYRKEISVASQTNLDNPSPIAEHKVSQQTPCLKHAAENIAVKATDLPSEKLSLCNNCSKSMLSYIFVVQDFLDSLTKEISVGANSQDCTQCLRERVRKQIIARSEEVAKMHGHSESSPSGNETNRIESSMLYSTIETDRGKSSEHETSNLGGNLKSTERKKSNRISEDQCKKDSKSKQSVDLSYVNPIQRVIDSSSNATPFAIDNSQKHQDGENQKLEPTFPVVINQQSSRAIHNQNFLQQREQPISIQNQVPDSNQSNLPQSRSQFTTSTSSHDSLSPHQGPNVPTDKQHIPTLQQPSIHHQPDMFVKPMERQQPNFDNKIPSQYNDGSGVNVNHVENVSSPLGDEVGRIVPPLTNTGREVYDSARNGAGWEGLTEDQDRLVAPDGRILSEAFVTMCRNNAEALGCLVVGTSLLLTQTTRTLCVLVSDGVSAAFREPLSSIFHVVQTVRSLDTLGTTKLALLEQPELGISFDKLNVWRLTQFQKCVYLNPDTLVIQNCDELLNRKELSAVPDIGWPDCFNSGVFVFAPSSHTFWQLLEFSDKQGSFDGGDQGLLNSYFSSWSSDISTKLSFIYNLMANVSYTYTPAFKQFGHNVKIVQFHGSFKPWHVKYFSHSGEISPASAVHPNYEQFVKKWIKMFQGSALRQLSQEIQSYAASQKVICAVELLRFFPLPSESEAEFFLTPPSVRLRLTELKLNRVPKSIEDAKRRKSAEFPRRTSEDRSKSIDSTKSPDSTVEETIDSTPVAEVEDKSEVPAPDSVFESPLTPVQPKDTETEKVVDDPNKLPGAEVGNYQGMKRWEQGKMDYQGSDSSDSILKRLEFLMSQPE